MLSSIHPFGERSRNNSFWSTAIAHVLGSTIGGAAFGLVFGTIGVAIGAVVDLSIDTRTALIVAASLFALVVEATGRERRLPSRTRQVNENWIQTYRGWVYGGGFGAELGFGISTIITTPLVHLLALTMVLVMSLPAALVLGSVFGAVRGATVLAAHRVDSPEALRRFHMQLDGLRSRSRSGAVASLALASIVGIVGVLT